MYKLSFEKCVCFIFLVVLAFLSCSGFRIDRLATMSDINKRNSFTSTSLSSNSNNYSNNDFLNRLFASSNYNNSNNYYNHFTSSSSSSNLSRYKRNIIPPPKLYHESFQINTPYQQQQQQTRRHRRRQHQGGRNRRFRNRRPEAAQASQIEPHPTGRIETIVIPPKDEINIHRFVLPQIPSPSEPTAASVSRSQRSPNKNKPQHQQQQQRNNRAYLCQRQDVARKAYLANTVVLAKAESMSTNRVHNYSVTFRILERYKTPLPIDDTLRLTFSSDTKDMNCEIEGHGRPHDLVKAQIQQSKEYFLFLNSHGMHNYSVVGMPVLKKKRNKKNKDLEDIKRVTNKNFVAKSPKKPKIKSNRTDDLKPGKKLRLVCNVKGFPVPYMSWSKDGLHPNKRTRITYKKKKTTLIINSVQVEDEGVYQCIAKGVDGTSVHDEVRVRISNRDECKDEQYKENFCLNGGTCVRIMHKEIACQCPDGFTGQRCGEKDVSNHSSMYGHNTFSCKLGLSTTYYC